MEIDQVSWCEIHILHICALLVTKIAWRLYHILGVVRDCALEYKLRMRYIRGTCILRLVTLVLGTCLGLFPLDRVLAIIPLRIDQG